jgi:hypothetical protein
LIGTILGVSAVCFATLNLYSSAVSSLLGSIIWWILFAQVIRRPLKVSPSN